MRSTAHQEEQCQVNMRTSGAVRPGKPNHRQGSVMHRRVNVDAGASDGLGWPDDRQGSVIWRWVNVDAGAADGLGYEFFNLLKNRSLYEQSKCHFVINWLIKLIAYRQNFFYDKLKCCLLSQILVHIVGLLWSSLHNLPFMGCWDIQDTKMWCLTKIFIAAPILLEMVWKYFSSLV